MKGDGYIHQGYRRVYCIDYPGSDKKGGIFEHVFNFENHYMCCMLPWGRVHHIDGNKLNNNIDNLEGMTWFKHMRIHASNRWSDSGYRYRMTRIFKAVWNMDIHKKHSEAIHRMWLKKDTKTRKTIGKNISNSKRSHCQTCIYCKGQMVSKRGVRNNNQRWSCLNCGKRFQTKVVVSLTPQT